MTLLNYESPSGQWSLGRTFSSSSLRAAGTRLGVLQSPKHPLAGIIAGVQIKRGHECKPGIVWLCDMGMVTAPATMQVRVLLAKAEEGGMMNLKKWHRVGCDYKSDCPASSSLGTTELGLEGLHHCLNFRTFEK